MNNQSEFLDLFRQVFRPRDVVELVDDLLGLCREREVELEWHADRCHIRLVGAQPEESIDVPLPKSAFCGVLARLAALCNERVPGSVSPYGGEGELAVGVDPATVYRIAFTNTSSEQQVRLTPFPQDGTTKGSTRVIAIP